MLGMFILWEFRQNDLCWSLGFCLKLDFWLGLWLVPFDFFSSPVMSSQSLLVFKFVVITIYSGCFSGGCCFFFFFLLDDAGDCIGTVVVFVTSASVVVAALFVTCGDSFAAVITVVAVVVAGLDGEFFSSFSGYLGPPNFFVGVVPSFRFVLQVDCCWSCSYCCCCCC